MTITATQNLTVTSCAACGMSFAVPEHWLTTKRDEGGSLFCPNGHSLTYGKRELDKVREQLAKEKSARGQAEARAMHEAAQRQEVEKKLHRTKQRIKGGKCPCCTHNFTSLARHMATKHPEYVAP